MRLALAEAKKAEMLHEVPIGAVVVLDGKVIGRGYNLRETTQDATTHAEMLAIKEACEKVGSWRLEDAALFVTLEPCPMCSGAMILSLSLIHISERAGKADRSRMPSSA